MVVGMHILTRWATPLLAALALAGCSSFSETSARWAEAITPYKPEVVQGNFVSREQAEALQPGMSRVQVRDILGTPLVTSVFHGDRWDYVFTVRRQSVAPQQRRLSVFFKDDLLDRVEGADQMPSESEFVDSLAPRRKAPKVPKLEASEQDLAKFRDQAATRRANEATAPSDAPTLAPAVNYPPLEAPR